MAQIVLAGPPVERAPAHRVHPQCGVPDIHAVIDRLGQALDIRQILGEGLPVPIDPGQHSLGWNVLYRGQAARKPLLVSRLARRQRKAAIAHHDASDAVPAGAAAERVPGDLRIHVGVAVDETGGNDQPVRIDRLLGGGADTADLDNPPALDADICAIARHSRAIDYGAVTISRSNPITQLRSNGRQP
jgi:hypothetical protein